MVVGVGAGSGGKRGQQRGRWPGVGGTFVMQDGRSGGLMGGCKGAAPRQEKPGVGVCVVCCLYVCLAF